MRSVTLNIPMLGKKSKAAPVFAGEKVLSIIPIRVVSNELKIVLSNARGYSHSYLFTGTEINNLKIDVEGYDSFWIERGSYIGFKQPLVLAIM